MFVLAKSRRIAAKHLKRHEHPQRSIPRGGVRTADPTSAVLHAVIIQDLFDETPAPTLVSSRRRQIVSL